MIVIKIDTKTNKQGNPEIISGFNDYGKIKKKYNPITKKWGKKDK
jgi:hypothetical protein